MEIGTTLDLRTGFVKFFRRDLVTFGFSRVRARERLRRPRLSRASPPAVVHRALKVHLRRRKQGAFSRWAASRTHATSSASPGRNSSPLIMAKDLRMRQHNLLVSSDRPPALLWTTNWRGSSCSHRRLLRTTGPEPQPQPGTTTNFAFLKSDRIRCIKRRTARFQWRCPVARIE